MELPSAVPHFNCVAFAIKIPDTCERVPSMEGCRSPACNLSEDELLHGFPSDPEKICRKAIL